MRPLLFGLAALLAAAALAVGAARLDIAAEAAAPHAGRLWRSSWIWLTGVFLFLYVGVENGLAGRMPSYALRVLGVSYRAMAAAQGGFWGAILGIRLFAPALLRRVPPPLLILSGLALASLGMILLLASAGARTLAAGALLAGAGLAAVFPTAVALFSERAGAQSVRVTGMVFAMSALGGATVPWAVGAISTRFDSLRLGLAVTLACSLLMIVLQFRDARSSTMQDTLEQNRSA